MNDDQIQKLRRIILGIESISSFSEIEIEELEEKIGKRNDLVSIA